MKYSVKFPTCAPSPSAHVQVQKKTAGRERWGGEEEEEEGGKESMRAKAALAAGEIE